MKNVIKNKNFWFQKKLYEVRKKFSRQNCSFQKDIQIYLLTYLIYSHTNYFFIRVISFHLFIKNVLMKIKISIFSPKYTRCEKNVREKNSLFQKDLQLWSERFFGRSYIFFLLMKNNIKNEKNLL